MTQLPNALSLTLCQHAIIEEKTRHVTLVNCFNRLTVGEFPWQQTFTVAATLTDGIGEGDLALQVRTLDTLDVIYSRDVRVRFSDPLRETRFLLRVSECSFPAVGKYEILLFIDESEIAHCTLTLNTQE